LIIQAARVTGESARPYMVCGFVPICTPYPTPVVKKKKLSCAGYCVDVARSPFPA